MLILTRKKDTSIIIDGQIRVTIVAIDRGYVRVGIEAPREMQILREELCERNQEQTA